jgi:hypothetical protein
MSAATISQFSDYASGAAYSTSGPTATKKRAPRSLSAARKQLETAEELLRQSVRENEQLRQEVAAERAWSVGSSYARRSAEERAARLGQEFREANLRDRNPRYLVARLVELLQGEVLGTIGTARAIAFSDVVHTALELAVEIDEADSGAEVNTTACDQASPR